MAGRRVVSFVWYGKPCSTTATRASSLHKNGATTPAITKRESTYEPVLNNNNNNNNETEINGSTLVDLAKNIKICYYKWLIT